MRNKKEMSVRNKKEISVAPWFEPCPGQLALSCHLSQTRVLTTTPPQAPTPQLANYHIYIQSTCGVGGVGGGGGGGGLCGRDVVVLMSVCCLGEADKDVSVQPNE